MDQDKKSGYRTLLTSMLLSSPGPLVLGLGLTVGHSSTQLSDFTRRTAEFLALIVAFAVYTVTNRRKMDEKRKHALERRGNSFVGVIMCVSGLSMILLTVLSGREDKGERRSCTCDRDSRRGHQHILLAPVCISSQKAGKFHPGCTGEVVQSKIGCRRVRNHCACCNTGIPRLQNFITSGRRWFRAGVTVYAQERYKNDFRTMSPE